MAWHSSLPSRSASYDVVAADWNNLIDNFNFLAEVNYTEYTANVAVTATTVGSATQVVSAGAITYTAAPHLIEFYCPHLASPAIVTNIILRDGTTVLGTIATVNASSPQTLRLQARVTPTAASHTYNIAAWLAAAGTATFNAGTGGATGDSTTYLPGSIRVYRIPT